MYRLYIYGGISRTSDAMETIQTGPRNFPTGLPREGPGFEPYFTNLDVPDISGFPFLSYLLGVRLCEVENPGHPSWGRPWTFTGLFSGGNFERSLHMGVMDNPLKWPKQTANWGEITPMWSYKPT